MTTRRLLVDGNKVALSNPVMRRASWRMPTVAGTRMIWVNVRLSLRPMAMYPSDIALTHEGLARI